METPLLNKDETPDEEAPYTEEQLLADLGENFKRGLYCGDVQPLYLCYEGWNADSAWYTIYYSGLVAYAGAACFSFSRGTRTHDPFYGVPTAIAVGCMLIVLGSMMNHNKAVCEKEDRVLEKWRKVFSKLDGDNRAFVLESFSLHRRIYGAASDRFITGTSAGDLGLGSVGMSQGV